MALIVQQVAMMCIFFWCMILISRITSDKFKVRSAYLPVSQKQRNALKSRRGGGDSSIGDTIALSPNDHDLLDKNTQYLAYIRSQNIKKDDEFAMIRLNLRTAESKYELVKQLDNGELEIHEAPEEYSPFEYTYDIPSRNFVKRLERSDSRLSTFAIESNRKKITIKMQGGDKIDAVILPTNSEAMFEQRVTDNGNTFFTLIADPLCTDPPDVLLPITFGQWLKYENIPNYDNESRSAILPYHRMKCVNGERVVVYAPKVARVKPLAKRARALRAAAAITSAA